MNAVLQVQDANESAAAERRALDLYATRPEVAKEIVERLSAEIRIPDIIIEPSAGPGRFVAAALAVWPRARVIAVDVDGAHRAACLAAGAAEFHECDWPTWVERNRRAGVNGGIGRLLILGNPPFSHATAHVDAALRLLREGEHLVFLLRLALLGAASRVAWWERSPLEEVPLIIPRPGFPKADGSNGSDNAEYGVYRWTKGYRGRPTIALPVLWGAAKAEAEAARNQLPLAGVAR
jgi:hypothetical protein